MAGITSLQSLYKSVLSEGHKEQNAAYPPHIFSEHVNIVTNFIIDSCVKMFPDTTIVGDIIRPFIASKKMMVISGVADFKEDYRNRLALKHFVKSEKKSWKSCGCEDDESYENDPLADSEEKKQKKAAAKAGCVWNDVEVLDVSEFGNRVNHSYKYPTLENPIGCIENGKGIKVCPYDIPYVEITYVMKPSIYNMGYVEQPDHTFVFSTVNTVESQWEDAAFPYLLKGLNTLYAIYTQSAGMRNWNDALKKSGMF